MATLDSIFDDLPLYPGLRIPPLQDPLPDLSARSARPSPLEPNALLAANTESQTAKLSGRSKALAEAKAIGDPAGSSDLRSIHRNPRKRQKLHEHERIADFVQLPQPKAKAKNDKPPPFQPVSVLNQLHEPPPSAALFPPITPNYGAGETTQQLSPFSPLRISPFDDNGAKCEKPTACIQDSPWSRRSAQRQRRKWTSLETEQLMKGIEIYGMGKWKKILHHAEFTFQPGRTPVDLKDHFRTKSKPAKPKRKRKRVASDVVESPEQDQGKTSVGLASEGSPPSSRNKWLDFKPCIQSEKDRKPWTQAEDCSLEEGYKKYGLSYDSIAKDAKVALCHRSIWELKERFQAKFPMLYLSETDALANNQGIFIQRRGGWTRAEDLDLEKGYRKHGFSWTSIVKDPELSLSHKTGPQARDRFRIRFPTIYEKDPPTSVRDKMLEVKRIKERERKQRAAENSKLKTMKGLQNSRGSQAAATNNAAADDNQISQGASSEQTTAVQNLKEDQAGPNKQSSSATGAFNIMGLLNSDIDDDRPSSPLQLDALDEHVTLAPLLWEEMATRPMFEL